MENTLSDFSNLKTKVSGKTLTLTIDLDKEIRPSTSGKTMLVSSSHGRRPLPDAPEGFHINVNIDKPISK